MTREQMALVPMKALLDRLDYLETECKKVEDMYIRAARYENKVHLEELWTLRQTMHQRAFQPEETENETRNDKT